MLSEKKKNASFIYECPDEGVELLVLLSLNL